MPEKLPKTGIISPKKIICIGSIVTNADGEIIGFNSNVAGSSWEEVVGTRPDGSEGVCVATYNNIIESYEIEGGIDLDTFTRFCAVSQMIETVVNNH